MSDAETTRAGRLGCGDAGVHDRLRGALRLSAEAVSEGEDVIEPSRDLLLFCHGFCTALDGHHRGEDTLLFPAVAAARPDLDEQVADVFGPL